MNAQTLETLYIYIYIDNSNKISEGRNTFINDIKKQIIFRTEQKK